MPTTEASSKETPTLRQVLDAQLVLLKEGKLHFIGLEEWNKKHFIGLEEWNKKLDVTDARVARLKKQVKRNLALRP